jgi:hypothetical protein
VKSPRIKLLGRVAGLPVYLVDGEKIRNETEIEFTSGGHGYVYPAFIPKGEVWLDDAIYGAIDLMATTYHEVIERDLMKPPSSWSYSRAHDVASKLEVEFRRRLAAQRRKTFDGALVTREIRATCPHCA